MAASTAALRGITKQYKDFTLGPVDMTVPAGSIVGLIGENGAGKTTLLKILCGVNRADDGTVDLLGGSPADAATRAKIGVVFEDAFFYGSFTAAQVARSLAGMYGARWNADSFSAYLRRFGLDAGKKLKEYSRGMRLKLDGPKALDKGGDGSKATVIDGSSCPVHNDTFNSFHTIYYYSVSRSKELPGRDQRRKRKREEPNGPEAFSLR